MSGRQGQSALTAIARAIAAALLAASAPASAVATMLGGNSNASATAGAAAGAAAGAVSGSSVSSTVAPVQSQGAVTVTNSTDRAASTAVAPGLAAGLMTCFGSAGVGVQGAGFGVSAGSSRLDDGCHLVRMSVRMEALGFTPAAVAIMCRDPIVAESMQVAGTPCPAPAAAPAAPGYRFPESM